MCVRDLKSRVPGCDGIPRGGVCCQNTSIDSIVVALEPWNCSAALRQSLPRLADPEQIILGDVVIIYSPLCATGNSVSLIKNIHDS